MKNKHTFLFSPLSLLEPIEIIAGLFHTDSSQLLTPNVTQFTCVRIVTVQQIIYLDKDPACSILSLLMQNYIQWDAMDEIL